VRVGLLLAVVTLPLLGAAARLGGVAVLTTHGSSCRRLTAEARTLPPWNRSTVACQARR